jgi:hypothetical protein
MGFDFVDVLLMLIGRLQFVCDVCNWSRRCRLAPVRSHLSSAVEPHELLSDRGGPSASAHALTLRNRLGLTEERSLHCKLSP